MSVFWTGLLASFIAGFFLAVLGTRKRWIPFSRFKSTGVVKVFANQQKALKSMDKDIKDSEFLNVLAMKGETFSNPERLLSRFLTDAGLPQRYLISSLENPYLEKRSEELGMNMQDSVARSIKNFAATQAKNPNIEVERHSLVVRFRLVLLSKYLYLSFQEPHVPGKDTAILKIRNNSSMYRCFASLFDDLWEQSDTST